MRGENHPEMIIPSVFSRVVASVCRIALALLVIIFLVWAFGIRMPGRNTSTAATLNNAEFALRAELIADVKAPKNVEYFLLVFEGNADTVVLYGNLPCIVSWVPLTTRGLITMIRNRVADQVLQ